MQKLEQEIKNLMELDSPHVVKIFEYWNAGDCVYIVQEPCYGGELFNWLSKKDSVNEHLYCIVIKQVLEALVHLHSKEVAH